jgi:hypothetical protein
MMRYARVFVAVVSLTLCVVSNAQQLDLFDPDDFVDPHEIRGRRIIFISRLVAGGASGYLDQYRPVEQNLGFVHLANSLYWSGFQIDFKRSEVRGENPPPMDELPCKQTLSAQASACAQARVNDGEPPAPGAKNVLQVAWYQSLGQRVTIRYRLAQARQYALPETAAHVPGLKSHDDTRIAQIDAGVRVHGRTLSGYVGFTELTRYSSLDKTKQQTLTLGAFLPLMSIGPAILTPRVQIAGIADVGPAIDVVNPSFDLSWTIPRVDTNVHLIYSPALGDLGNGTRVTHQVVVYVDRAILVLPWGSH